MRGGANPDNDRYQTVGDFIIPVVNLIVGLAIAASVIGMIISGVHYATSKGDYKAVDKARKSLTYAVIAAIVSVAAFAIMRLVFGLVGVSSISGSQIGLPDITM